MPHLIQRVAILGTGLIGGSFAKALRKYTPDMIIAGWDREEVAHQLKSSGVANQTFSGAIEPENVWFATPELFSWCATSSRSQPAMIMSGVYFRRALAKEPPMRPVPRMATR